MPAVNECIVRDYFEHLGYFVSQPRKYTVPGRPKTADEEIDLIVCNPLVTEHRIPERVVWTSEELRTVGCAVIGIRGWHTDRFSATTFEQSPDILRFAEEESLRTAQARIGPCPVAKVLCMPHLPASEELREKTLLMLREKGIDGILQFPTMLAELMGWVDVNRNYEKSDVLQVIRILKAYGLLADPQMELFGRRRGRGAKAGRAKRAERGQRTAEGEVPAEPGDSTKGKSAEPAAGDASGPDA